MSFPLTFPINRDESSLSYSLTEGDLQLAMRLAPATIAYLESLSTAFLKEQGEVVFRGSPESQFDELKRHISLTAKREFISFLLEGAAEAYTALATAPGIPATQSSNSSNSSI